MTEKKKDEAGGEDDDCDNRRSEGRPGSRPAGKSDRKKGPMNSNETWLDQLGSIIRAQKKKRGRQKGDVDSAPLNRDAYLSGDLIPDPLDPYPYNDLKSYESFWSDGEPDSEASIFQSPTPKGYNPIEGFDFSLLRVKYISDDAEKIARSILSGCVCDFCGEPFPPPYDAYGDVSVGIYCSPKCTDRGIRAYVKAIINIRRYGMPPPP